MPVRYCCKKTSGAVDARLQLGQQNTRCNSEQNQELVRAVKKSER